MSGGLEGTSVCACSVHGKLCYKVKILECTLKIDNIIIIMTSYCCPYDRVKESVPCLRNREKGGADQSSGCNPTFSRLLLARLVVVKNVCYSIGVNVEKISKILESFKRYVQYSSRSILHSN